MSKIKSMTFKTEYNKLVKKHGRKRDWVASQMDMYAMELFRKIQKDKLNTNEKAKIRNLIINGK